MTGLNDIPFFHNVDFKDKNGFEMQCAIKKFNGGDTIVDFCDDSQDVGFILLGSVRVLIRNLVEKETIYGDLGVGNFIGEMSAIDGLRRSANVIALTSCKLFIVPGNLFRETCFNSPVLSQRISLLFIDRIRELNTRLFERQALDAKHRLYSELLRMAKPSQSDTTRLVISPAPFQYEMSSRVGCDREEINAEINTMIKNGWLEKTATGLIITDPTNLKKQVHDAMLLSTESHL